MAMTALPAPRIDAAPPVQPHVLVVDDSQPDRARLAEILRRMGMIPFGAGSAREALECLERERIDVVVSDWMMPGMSGIDLCRELLQEPRFGRPHFIMVTGRRQPADLIAGMDAGADDFLAKPVSREELRVRVQAGLRMLQLRRDLLDGQNALQAALQNEAARTERLRHDLAAAAGLQRSLLPQAGSPLQCWDIACLYEPAEIIGGDMLGLHAVGSNQASFFSVDVCGHGIPAAMQSIAYARRLTPGPRDTCLLFDNGSDRARPAAAVMAGLNAQCCAEVGAAPLAAAYGRLDGLSGRGELCLAGHPHALLLRRDGRHAWIGEPGLPAGASTRAQYQAARFEMAPGDRLVLFTDGLLAGAPQEQTYEDARDRLARLLATTPPGLQPLADALHRDAQRPPTDLTDDRSALLIERLETSSR